MNAEQLKDAKDYFFIALGFDIAVTAMVAIAHIWTINILTDIRSGAFVADQSTTGTIDFWASFSKLTILTTIAVGIGLVYWLGACYRYAKETLKTTGLMQEKWKAWGWIVPFMNFFKPYQVIKEIYKVGAPDYAGSDEWKKLSGSNMLLGWWVFWVIAHMVMWSIVKQTIRGAAQDDLTLIQILGMYYGSVAACAISLIIAGLWFVVAGRLTQRLLARSVPPIASVAPARPLAPYNSHESVASAATPRAATTPVASLSATHPSDSTMIDEDAIYATIANELETGGTDKGLWTRLFAENDGDENRTKVAYIRQRVEKLKAFERARLTEIERLRREEAENLAAAERAKRGVEGELKRLKLVDAGHFAHATLDECLAALAEAGYSTEPTDEGYWVRKDSRPPAVLKDLAAVQFFVEQYITLTRATEAECVQQLKNLGCAVVVKSNGLTSVTLPTGAKRTVDSVEELRALHRRLLTEGRK